MQAAVLLCTSRVVIGIFLLTTAVAAAEPVKATEGSLFKPSSVPSLGTLTVASGATVTFDTGSAGNPPAVSGAITGAGTLGASASGKVELALFAFDGISLGAGATVVVTGDRGLVLLSKGNVAIDTTLSVRGADGVPWHGDPAAIASGGPGAEGGEYGKTFKSAPPPADAGDGGPPMKDNGKPGRGFGSGFNERVKGVAPGGGGAYGGNGGASSEGSGGNGNPPRPCPGGTTYGDPALADLFGGSGGAGASNDRGTNLAGGGAGGGAIAVIAATEISLGDKGAILAYGGDGGKQGGGGGGGSGGAILLAAPVVKIAPSARVDVHGGAGGSGGPHVAAGITGGRGRRHAGSGGGGGGGRIAIYTTADLGTSGKNAGAAVVPDDLPLNIDGGNGGYLASDGEPGTWYDGRWPNLK